MRVLGALLVGAVGLLSEQVASANNFGYLYINRCGPDGCIVHKGGDDARTLNTEGYFNDDPPGTEYHLSAWSHGDAKWADLMQCLREVYSPYNVTVSDQPPPPGMPFSEALVAGSNREVNSPGAGGYAALNDNCTARSYGLSFTFANDYPATTADDLYAICGVVGQETAHSFGLRHSYEFLDGRSAGPDPMTYRPYRGQQFFRNEPARCGEFSVGTCGNCGPAQNTHQHLTLVLGEGTPITPPPDITLTGPANGATISNGAAVTATAQARRGVFAVDLLLNGYKWTTAKGSYDPGRQGFSINLPPDVPDGIIDVVLRARDDIGMATDTPVITVTKGQPCVTADTCAAGQRCDAGKCLWDPPTGQLGDECTYKQFCVNENCASLSDGEMRCAQACVLGISDNCPDGFECIAQSDTGGLCWPSSAVDKGNCLGCASGGPAAGLFGVGLAPLLLRPRRRSGRR